MSNKIKIDFNKLAAVDVKERTFFILLLKVKRVIYDWGCDNLWVLEDYNNEQGSKKYSIKGEEFIQRTKIDVLTSADVVTAFFANGIDVEIRNYRSTFRTEKEKEEYMNEYRELAKRIGV